MIAVNERKRVRKKRSKGGRKRSKELGREERMGRKNKGWMDKEKQCEGRKEARNEGSEEGKERNEMSERRLLQGKGREEEKEEEQRSIIQRDERCYR